MRMWHPASSLAPRSIQLRGSGLCWFQVTRASKALLLCTVLLAQLGMLSSQATPADNTGRFVFFHRDRYGSLQGSGVSTRLRNGPQGQHERRQQITEMALYEVRTSHAANPAVHIDIASALEGTFAKNTNWDTWVFLGGQERISTVENVSGVVSIQTIDLANKVMQSISSMSLHRPEGTSLPQELTAETSLSLSLSLSQSLSSLCRFLPSSKSQRTRRMRRAPTEGTGKAPRAL